MILAVIPAQGTSRRLPGKNMRKVLGKPLVYWAVEAARNSEKIGDIVVSTDSEEIARYAQSENIPVIIRDDELCGDATVVDVYRDALLRSNFDNITHVVAIQPDHPDRVTNIDDAIELVLSKNITDFITTDRFGVRHGSIRIMEAQALKERKLSYTCGAWVDNCTNIHTHIELLRAEASLLRQKTPIMIDGFPLSESSPTYIVAEAGANHNANLQTAKMMIEQAKDAGANAIKFQSYKAEKLVTRGSRQYWKQDRADASQFAYYKTLDRFKEKDYRELFAHCKEKGITFLTTPFDYEFVDFFADLGITAFKIASCDLPDTHFVRHVASKGKPVIISTGASTMEEVRKAVDAVLETGNRDIVLLQCSLAYPTKDVDAHLRQIPTLKSAFPEAIIGISDHTFPDESLSVPTAAVALGAKLIEKHYTFCRNQPTNSHQFSIDPVLLERMIKNIRIVEKALGRSDMFISEAEKPARENARRSITALVNISAGTTIKHDMLIMRRPATGLAPDMIDQVVGRKAKVEIQEDSILTVDMLAERR